MLVDEWNVGLLEYSRVDDELSAMMIGRMRAIACRRARRRHTPSRSESRLAPLATYRATRHSAPMTLYGLDASSSRVLLGLGSHNGLQTHSSRTLTDPAELRTNAVTVGSNDR